MTLYHREIDVTDNSGSSLSNYQTKITFGSGDPIFTNGSSTDIRFRDGNGNLLDHWIETFDAANDTATIWVKVPSIPASGTTRIHLFYGDGQNVNPSSGEATFEFFDNFEDGSIGSKWNIVNGTGLSESGGTLNATNTTSQLESDTTYNSSDSWVMETEVEHYTMPNNGYTPLQFGHAEGTDGWGLLVHPGSPDKAYEWYDGSYDSNNANFDLSTLDPYQVKLISRGDGNCEAYLYDNSGGTLDSYTHAVSFSGQPINLIHRDGGFNGQSMDARWRWIRLREYASSEPSVSVNSETNTTPVHPNATYVSDDEVDFSWSGEWKYQSGFSVEMIRDDTSWVSPSGGPSSTTDYDYFGEVGSFDADAEDLGPTDGFNSVHKFDATTNSGFEDIFTSQFVRSDFSGSGDGQYAYMAFAAKWNNIPYWGYTGTWVKKPAPDPNNYQLYILKSDANNSNNEYFRLYYGDNDDTSVAYIADPIVWKGEGWEIQSSDAEMVGTSSDRTVNVVHKYGPNSDNPYNTQVGIDSSFQFRVRANGLGETTSWSSASDTVYTSPIPPHNPSVTRPDANTVELSFEVKSDVLAYSLIYLREDTGSGYGPWELAELASQSSKGPVTVTMDTTNDMNYRGPLKEDARYQFNIHSRTPEMLDSSGSPFRNFSSDVYADYGNNGNVFFTDDFEDQSLSDWTTVDTSNSNSGIVGTLSNSLASWADTSPDEGSYALQLAASDSVAVNLGDLSNESNVIVKMVVQSTSMDSDGEFGLIQFYDGSTYQTIKSIGTKYNLQGWFEVNAVIPSSYLSSDNRLRIEGGPGGGDAIAIDRVVVSDILHEYTEPVAPSNISFDTSVENELTVDWNQNASFVHVSDPNIKKTSESSWTSEWWRDPPVTFTSGGSPDYTILDGEKYDVQVRNFVRQDRNGTYGTNWWSSQFISSSATSLLPPVNNLKVVSIDGDKYVLSWDTDQDNGNLRVYISTDGGSTYVDDSGQLTYTNEAYKTSSLSDTETHTIKVTSETEHTTSDSETTSATLGGSVKVSIDGVVQTLGS